MKKAEFIARYGKDAWDKHLAQTRTWYKAHREEKMAYSKKYREANPEKVIANQREQARKGGKRYEKKLEYNKTGLPSERNKIRAKHQRVYHPFKMIIAPDSEIHHEWIPLSSEYRGLALVEAKPHQYGIIDVILILDGTITLLTEEDVKNGKKKQDDTI